MSVIRSRAAAVEASRLIGRLAAVLSRIEGDALGDGRPCPVCGAEDVTELDVSYAHRPRRLTAHDGVL